MKTTPYLTLALMLASGTLAHAQFALSLPKAPSAAPSSDAGSDPAALLAKGNRLIVFSTIATDLDVSSAQKMLEAFPPAKIAKIKAKFAKYDELKSKRADKDQLDADSCTVASDAFEEMAKLNVEGYDKAKAKVVVPAYSQMGLAAGADGIAATQLPPFVKSVQSTITSLAGNPLQASKVIKLKDQVAVTNALVVNTPKQVNAMKTVRGMAKKIADAEHFKLGEPKVPTTVDPEALAKASKAEQVEG